MLVWTSEAAELVGHLARQAAHAADPGVRITVDRRTHSLRMSVVKGPSVDDTVLSRDGARLFLCPDAVTRLRDARLHAHLGPRGGFVLDLEPAPRSWLWNWTGGLVL
jgi:Fe-S cluster assembly iron-binding protein IscA